MIRLGGLLGIVGLGVATVVVATGCGGSSSTEATSRAAAHTTASTTPPSPTELKAEAAQRKKEAAEAKQREAAARREAAEQRRQEAARRHREAAERQAEEHLGHGLGATASSFNAQNTVGEGPDPPAGVAWYHVLYKDGDRVAAFNINANFSPPMSPHELITLMAAHNLPDDAEVVTEHESCILWRSPTLGRLLGSEYAEGFVEPAGEGKYAELITTTTPECK